MNYTEDNSILSAMKNGVHLAVSMPDGRLCVTATIPGSEASGHADSRAVVGNNFHSDLIATCTEAVTALVSNVVVNAMPRIPLVPAESIPLTPAPQESTATSNTQIPLVSTVSSEEIQKTVDQLVQFTRVQKEYS